MKQLNQLRELRGKFKQRFHNILGNDIGIDLGTANTLVYLKGRGVVLSEPSIVAINEKTGRVVAVGAQAKEMLGRTPAHINAIRPMVDGVISDFEVTEEMLAYLLNRTQNEDRKLFGPRVVVGVPSGITNVETRAVRDAARNAGAREVHIVEEPMAAAIGIRLPIDNPEGNMLIDIGGGTCDIVVISLGGVVISKNVRIAGDQFNNDIISYVRNQFKVLIGEKTAEDLKIDIGSVADDHEPLEVIVRGRDLVTGLPREVVITNVDIRDAISHSVDQLIEATRGVLEATPPELLSDIMQKGISLTGGGALLRGLAEVLSDILRIPVYVAEDPLTAVVRGTGIILEDIDSHKEVLISGDDEGFLPTA